LLIHTFLADSLKPGPYLRLRLLTADTRVYSRPSPFEGLCWMIWNESGVVAVLYNSLVI